MSIDSKIIGFFAHTTPIEIVCDGDACIIAGSEEAMRRYLKSLASNVTRRPMIRKAKFGDIVRAMNIGASYAFDEESYNRFFPLANTVGFSLKQEKFSGSTETGNHFVVLGPPTNVADDESLVR